MEKKLIKIATAVFFLSLILLSIIRVEETDAWLHLSMGREIFRLRALPATEPFTYPSFGQPFLYTSWLFGLVLYLTYLAGGYAGIIVLKAALVTLAVVILYKDAVSPYRERLVAIVILSIFVFMYRYRFVERPDMVLMVCLSATVYALDAYVYRNKKYIYGLPAVAFIWAGCHSSIVLMPVPFIAFIAGAIIHRRIGSRIPLSTDAPSPKQMKTVAAVFLVSAAATLINPDFLAQYTYGQSLLTSGWYKRNIVELNPMTGQELLTLGIGVAVTLFSCMLNRKRFSPMHLLLVLPFILLPFSARRFHFIFGLIAAPVVARNIAGFACGSERLRSALRHPATALVTIVWITGYTVLGLAGVQPIGYDFKQFGFGVNESMIPAGAVRYMDANDIYGRSFSTFHWGGYLVWTGYPRRTVFIEPRGYLTEDLLEQYSLAMDGNLWALERLYGTYGFDTVLLEYPKREEGGRNPRAGLVLSHPDWALVYWDDTSLLYLRRGGRYQSVILRDEYRFVVPAAGRTGISSRIKDPGAVAGVERDLLRNIRETSSAMGYGLLGHLYNKTGRYGDAISAFSKVMERPRQVDRLSAYTGLGTAYYQLREFDKSLRYYEEAVKLRRDGTFLYNLATIYVAKGDDQKAIKTLSEAIEADPSLEVAYSLLAATYERLGKHDEAANVRRRYLQTVNGGR